LFSVKRKRKTCKKKRKGKKIKSNKALLITSAKKSTKKHNFIFFNI